MPEYTKKEAKEWAREKYRGLENVLLPSLKIEELEDGDTMNLDPEGIRHDMDMCKKHGFFMTTVAIEGLPFLMTEYMVRELFECAVEAANKEILVDSYISGNTLDDTIAIARAAEESGADAMMLAFPPYFYPKSEDEVVGFVQAVADKVNLAITAYATHKPNYERFHNSTFSPQLVSRICDIENVVAVKLGVLDPSHNAECFELCGHKALLAAVFPDLWNVFVRKYGQQWAGSAPYEVFQDPERRLLVDQFELMAAGRFREAMDLHWKLYPAMKIIEQLVEYTVYEGNYNVMHWKYFGWLAGMNGGPMTLPTARLYEHQKMMIIKARQLLGLSLPDNDEGFYIGRVNMDQEKAAA